MKPQAPFLCLHFLLLSHSHTEVEDDKKKVMTLLISRLPGSLADLYYKGNDLINFPPSII